MGDIQACPECGRRLPEAALEGICPVCSLQRALQCPSPLALRASPRAPGVSSPSPPQAPLPTCFGDYELLELLARGGMGVVYKARQISLNRTVALKTIQAGVLASPAEVKRFHTEAEAIAQFHHPNIVAVYEIGEREGQHYFSMDYVAGQTLAEIVRGGPLPVMRAANYVKTIAAAMHYAHQHGILHRDLKPANIIIDENDEPRITDFGLAKRLSDSQVSACNPQLTLSGQVLGSPNYLPPEQAEPRRGTPGPPSDVYALGAILYHLVTGRPPFQAESLTTLLRQVVETDPVPPRSLNPSIPRDLETICLKCLVKDPRHRYGTAQGLADDLARFLNHESVLARPVGAGEKAWRWCRRQPVRAGLIAALVSVLLLGIVGISWQWRRAERERQSAIANEQSAVNNERLALRQAYAGDMLQAQRAVEDGDLTRAHKVLDRLRPTSDGGPGNLKPRAKEDLRAWEWRYLWGLCASDAHEILTQKTNFEKSVAFHDIALSPDGKVLAARFGKGEIELWNLANRRQIKTLFCDGWGQTTRFAADGSYVAAYERDTAGTAYVGFWDWRSGEKLRSLCVTSGVTSLTFSLDGKHMVTGHRGVDYPSRLWELPSGKLLLRLPACASVKGFVPVALFSPDGATVALGEATGHIQLLRLATGVTNVIPPPVEGQSVSALAFMPEGRLLASGYSGTDPIIYLWDVASGQQVARFKGQPKCTDRLLFDRGGQTLYSASRDQSIYIWDVPGRTLAGRLQGHVAVITALALSADGRSLISSAHDGSIRLWKLPAQLRSSAHVQMPVLIGTYGSAFTPDSRRLITASPTNSVTVWEAGTTNQIQRISALGTNNLGLALSPDEQLLAIGGGDGTIKIWDLKRQCLVKQWQAHDNSVMRLVFLDAGKSLVSMEVSPYRMTKSKRWASASWMELSGFQPHLTNSFGLAPSPDCRHLAIVYSDKALRVYDSESWDQRAILGPRGGLTPAFSPEGKLVAAALPYVSRAQIWEVGSWREVARLEQACRCVAFSGDGRRLVLGSDVAANAGETVHIWDYAVERELLSLRTQDSSVYSIQFSPDGNTLLAVSESGVAELWRAPSWAEIEAAETRTR